MAKSSSSPNANMWRFLGVSMIALAMMICIPQLQPSTKTAETVVAIDERSNDDDYNDNGVFLRNYRGSPSPAIALRNLTQSEKQSVSKLIGPNHPVVIIEEYNLAFFVQQKVASITFTQLLRRMMHYGNWTTKTGPINWYPKATGLKYLKDYSPDEWSEMMTSPDWTRSIFVRDPRERVLSAYLDKVVNDEEARFVHAACCSKDPEKSCSKEAKKSFESFLRLLHDKCCCNSHWAPQSQRMNWNVWKFINFIGHFENIAADTKNLLQGLSPEAWTLYGESGWGDDGDQPIFGKATGARHATGASDRVKKYFNSSEVNRLVEELYMDDYAHPALGFERKW